MTKKPIAYDTYELMAERYAERLRPSPTTLIWSALPFALWVQT